MEPPKFILSRASSSILNRKGYSECTFPCFHFFFLLLLKRFIYLFLEMGGREGEREGEKHPCVVASHASPTGDLACTPACAVTENRTGDPLVHRPALNPLSYTSQGGSLRLLK